jgi:phage gp36-like protein
MYATVAEYILYVGTDEYNESIINTLGVSDPNIITLKLDFASSVVDSYVSCLYLLPIIGTVPGIIKYLEIVIARYYGNQNITLTKENKGRIFQEYDNALKTLKDICAGRIPVDIPINPNKTKNYISFGTFENDIQ